MDFDKYQRMAARTQNNHLTRMEAVNHAVLGINSEAGELAGLFQKGYQGHEVRIEDVIKETGDILWFIAELCDMYGIKMQTVAEENIAKLMKRYPEGFESERSLHRSEI